MHCGFCTATCPTYLLLGDELDSPRGRIYLIKDMLENGKPATPQVVKHIDRCLSCLSCMTTCPSGVHYMHLVDHARAYIEETYQRPLARSADARRCSRPCCPIRCAFALALLGAGDAQAADAAARRKLPVVGARLAAMLDLAPRQLPDARARAARRLPGRRRAPRPRGDAVRLRAAGAEARDQRGRHPAAQSARRRGRAAQGRGLLRRARASHGPRRKQAHAFAQRNIDAWTREIEGEGLDAIVITASGCGTTIKDYGFMFRNDPAYAEKAPSASPRSPRTSPNIVPSLELCAAIARDGPCRRLSLGLLDAARAEDHGPAQEAAEGGGLRGEGRAGGPHLLRLGRHLQYSAAGDRRPAPRAQGRQHRKDRARHHRHRQYRLHDADRQGPRRSRQPVPIVHTVELLDWATGGPMPAMLEQAGFTHRYLLPQLRHAAE